MTKYQNIKVKLSNSQRDKLKSITLLKKLRY